MSAFPWIVGGAAVGLGYLWWKNQQAKAKPSSSPDCTALCTAALGPGATDPMQMSACQAACAAGINVLGDLVNWIRSQPWGDTGATIQQQETAERDAAARNKALNGAITVPLDPVYAHQIGEVSAGNPNAMSGSSYGLRGDALEYSNGCMPFRGSFGWPACKPGTQDMFNVLFSATDGVQQIDQAVKTPVAKTTPDGEFQYVPQWLATDLGGGSFDPNHPDLATHGPWVSDAGGKYAANGSFWSWFVGGSRVTCPAGQTPSFFDGATGKPTSTPTTQFYGYPCVGAQQGTPSQGFTQIGGGATGRAAPSSTQSPGTLATRGQLASSQT